MAVAAACLALAAGCTSASGSDQAGSKGADASATPAAQETGPITVRVTPNDGAKKVKPNESVKVSVSGGALTTVTVKKTGGGKKIHGEMAGDGTSWTSSVLLRPSASYVVRVKAKNDARTKKERAAFTTLTPSSTVKASIAPLDGMTVGVGQPIGVYLSNPVRDRAAVEKALKVTTNKDVHGVWHWFSDDELHFRPRDYWPAHTKVTLHADLAGVHAGPGRWGAQDRTIKFRVGDKHVSTVHAKTHQMRVRSGGDLVKKMPVSTGRPEYPTKSGVHVVMSKSDPYQMDSTTAGITGSDAYNVTVRYAVRISNSGEFVHAAPWSVGSQGSANVSHGCVNLSMARAAWFYDFSQPGDIVRVKGTDAQLQPTNGFGDWNVAWKKWVEGSALH
ncbi:MAG: L,D-transpeptidase [Streptosporangiales bacterium]